VSRASVTDGTLDEWKAFFTEANDAHGTFSFSLDPPMKLAIRDYAQSVGPEFSIDFPP
jgi:hypothetical protein